MSMYKSARVYVLVSKRKSEKPADPSVKKNLLNKKKKMLGHRSVSRARAMVKNEYGEMMCWWSDGRWREG